MPNAAASRGEPNLAIRYRSRCSEIRVVLRSRWPALGLSLRWASSVGRRAGVRLVASRRRG
eukprot:2504247-Lingulodinium_polyedra.AAC.1